MKIHYFIEEKRDQKRHQNLIKVEKKRNTDRKRTKEKLICTPQISTTTRRFQLQNCQITEQLNANRSQPSLGPLSFTV